ncbi:MAG: antibiotic biosynthesis monooxygenase [Firmicutes bacterium]|nr:antibiotic biosynthesis monooxygenase [Bacillota bacterium]
MTNFFVTYNMPDKASRDGYYREVHEREIDRKSREENGCYKYEFFFPAESDTQLFLWEQWETREHQKIHCTTEHFLEMGPLKEKYGVTTDIIIEESGNIG